MFSLFLEAAAQVAVVALVLGAGLPVLFAVGVRSFALAGGASPDGSGADGRSSGASTVGSSSGLPSPLLRAIGIVCFAVVVLAVVVGLTLIIATGFGQEVSFENVFPTFVPKE